MTSPVGVVARNVTRAGAAFTQNTAHRSPGSSRAYTLARPAPPAAGHSATTSVQWAGASVRNRTLAPYRNRPGAETEELALFVLHRGPLAHFVPMVLELRRTLLRHTGLEATHVVPVRQVPKTSSGKLQRQ